VEKGLEPIFIKKRNFKERDLKKKFDKLEASGGTEKFLEKQIDLQDRKRAKRH
jgi:hypothetical protein